MTPSTMAEFCFTIAFQCFRTIFFQNNFENTLGQRQSKDSLVPHLRKESEHCFVLSIQNVLQLGHAQTLTRTHASTCPLEKEVQKHVLLHAFFSKRTHFPRLRVRRDLASPKNHRSLKIIVFGQISFAISWARRRILTAFRRSWDYTKLVKVP